MVYLYLSLGIVTVFFQAVLSYSKQFHDNALYYPTGLFLNLVGAFFWYYIAKNSAEKSTLFLSLLWDASIVIFFVTVPILFFGVRLTSTETLGILIVILGFVIIKL